MILANLISANIKLFNELNKNKLDAIDCTRQTMNLILFLNT